MIVKTAGSGSFAALARTLDGWRQCLFPKLFAYDMLLRDRCSSVSLTAGDGETNDCTLWEDVHCKDLWAHLMRRGQANILRYVMLIDVVSLTFKI